MTTIIVVAPNSFKGSLSSSAAAEAMAAGIREVSPGADVRVLPMADGGEGSLDAIVRAQDGRLETATVTGANGTPVEAAFAVIRHHGVSLAVIEAAQIVGLSLVDPQRDPAAQRDTRGIGELIRIGLDRGLRHFLLALGGSSTNDGGAGLLAALGARLLAADGHSIEPTPLGLRQLARVDLSALDPRLRESRITLLADVTNPLLGEQGATAVYGPQKGVARADVAPFEQGLARLAEKIATASGQDFAPVPGAGAAGGLGFAGLVLGGELHSGAEYIAELIGLPAALDRASWAITGEGRSDAQTLSGKAPGVVARLVRARGVPVVLLSGDIDPAARPVLERHFSACYSLVGPDVSCATAQSRARALLAVRAAEIARDFRARG